jgi:SAM-dependent methyltransferase
VSSSSTNEYVLGTRDDELDRLGLQHRLWTRQAFALWERAGFGPNQTILDLGCGPGFTSLDLATWIGPSGKVLAIDSSERFIAHLETRRQALGIENVDARVGDALNLDLPNESLDGAFARWLLCFLPRPEEAIRQVAAALKPGGVFATQDYFNYRGVTVAPRSAAMDRVVCAVEESWKLSGGDINVSARIPAMMADCGLEVRSIDPLARVARAGSALWQWPLTFFGIFVPTLVSKGLVTQDDADEFASDLRQRSTDPSAFFCTPPMFDIVGVKK